MRKGVTLLTLKMEKGFGSTDYCHFGLMNVMIVLHNAGHTQNTHSNNMTMTKTMLRDELVQNIERRGLEKFMPFIDKIISAYDGFPDIEDYDTPQQQLLDFLRRCDDLDEADLVIHFKHEISKLRIYGSRAYCPKGSDITFFNPLHQTYKEFAQSAETDPITTYLTVTGYPSQDIILKSIEHSIR